MIYLARGLAAPFALLLAFSVRFLFDSRRSISFLVPTEIQRGPGGLPPGISGPRLSRLAAKCLSFTFRSTKLPLWRSECVVGTYYRLPRRLRISLAATTPEAEACMRPLVMPAPSPMANMLCTWVSRALVTASLDE